MSVHLDSILHHVLDGILFKEFSPDIVEAVCETLFVLVILRQSTYSVLVNQILDQYNDSGFRPRIEVAFKNLSVAIDRALRADPHVMTRGNHGSDGMRSSVVMDKTAWRGFQDAFISFLMDVRGVLRVR